MALIYKKHKKVQMFHSQVGKFGVAQFDPNSQQVAEQAKANTPVQQPDDIFKDPTQESGEYDADVKMNSSPLESVPKSSSVNINDPGGDVVVVVVVGGVLFVWLVLLF